MTINDSVKKILVSEEEIETIVCSLADKLNFRYKDKEVVLILVLKGSVIFCADLMRKLTFPVILETMKVSSYGSGTVSTGELSIDLDIKTDISGKHVLIIEDIIDSGNTLYKLKKMLGARNPESIAICTFLDKPERREADITADYTGTVIPDEFVVGYGLDYDEKFRELPYVGVLGEWVYEK